MTPVPDKCHAGSFLRQRDASSFLWYLWALDMVHPLGPFLSFTPAFVHGRLALWESKDTGPARACSLVGAVRAHVP